MCTRGYLVMRGYWENPEATSEAIDEAAGCTPATSGVMDGDGYLNIVGRIKDMVIRGGENLYPREIEEVLFEHPAVGERTGDRRARRTHGRGAHGVGRGARGRGGTEDELRQFCRSRVAHFKVPRYLRSTTEFPMTVTGQDPEVQNARDRDRGARPRGGCFDHHRLSEEQMANDLSSWSGLLVANRGEIAVRIIRAAAELGVRASRSTRRTTPTRCMSRAADEAIALRGRGPAAYLDAEQILDVARRNRAATRCTPATGS